MKRELKIVHVETGTNLYGGALQVHYLLRGLAEEPTTRNVLVCPSGSTIAKTSAENVDTLYAVPAHGDLDLPFLFRLISIIRKEMPDIVHLHSRRGADVLGGLAARITGTRCLLTRRVDNPENKFIVGLKYRLFHHVVTISEGIREVLISEGVPSGKITCVPSAVDIDHYSVKCDREWFRKEFSLEENVQACGVVAQFIERKGHRYLLEAIPGILHEEPDSIFFLFGKGPMEEELRAICQNLGIEKKVIFAGFRKDLDRIMGCLDLLIHPALMEGLGVSLLQAAAASVPIVGTQVGGIPEIVMDGVNGYLIPKANPEAISEASLKLLRKPARAREMGLAGRRTVRERFSIRAMVNGNLSVYRSFLLE